MIDFNEHDYNLPQIRRESKLFNLVTRHKYHVYGLRQEDNPPILIEYNIEYVNENFEKLIVAVLDFLKNNGIDAQSWNEADTNQIDIGLRKDLRGFLSANKKPLLASSVL